MPMPAPPRRQCTRHSKDGQRCTAGTVRADRWCGTCDGYLNASGPAPSGQNPRVFGSCETDMPPLDGEDAYEISVTRDAKHAYTARHGGTFEQAEVALRSLLEDALLLGKHGTRTAAGRWAVGTDKFTYAVYLSPDLEALVHYRTAHAERTWAQVKAGVRSRITHRTKKRAKWLTGVAQTCQDMPVRVSDAALLGYANHHDGRPGEPEDMEAFCARFRISLEAALTYPDRPETGKFHVPDPDVPGCGWHFYLSPFEGGDSPVVRVHSYGPPKPQPS